MQWGLGAVKLFLLLILVGAASQVIANNNNSIIERIHKSTGRNAVNTASRLEQHEANKKSQIERLHKVAERISSNLDGSQLDGSQVPILDERLQGQVDLEGFYQQEGQAKDPAVEASRKTKSQNAMNQLNKQHNQVNQNIKRLSSTNQREVPSNKIDTSPLQHNQSSGGSAGRHDSTVSNSRQKYNDQARRSTSTRPLADQKQRYFTASSNDTPSIQKKERVSNQNSYRNEQLRGIQEHGQELQANDYKHHFVSYRQNRNNMRSQNQSKAEAEDKSADNANEGDESSNGAASVTKANEVVTDEGWKINKAIIAKIIIIFIVLMSLSIPVYALFLRFRTKRPSNN